MTDNEPAGSGSGRVSRTAIMLGFAGLLPQIASVGVLAASPIPATWNWVVPLAAALAVAVAYPLLILSFLGGIWWGLAIRRGEASQGRLATIAVAPSLVAFVLACSMLISGHVGWPLVVTGSVVALTLLADRHLVATGDAPVDWMRLRVPLSLGLGGLTIVAGALAGRAGLPG